MSRFVEKGGQKSYRPWDKWELGMYFIGKYKGEGKIDQYGKPSYEFETMEHDMEEYVDSKGQTRQPPEVGGIMSLNSCGSLNYKVEEVSIGDIVKIVYDGEDVVSKGAFKGKPFHKVNLFVDESTIDADEIKNTQDMITKEDSDEGSDEEFGL